MDLFQHTNSSHPHEAQHLEFLIVQQSSFQVVLPDLNRKLITSGYFCFVFRKIHLQRKFAATANNLLGVCWIRSIISQSHGNQGAEKWLN